MKILKHILLYFLTNLYLKDSSAARFKKTSSNLTAVEGGMVVLRCEFTRGMGLKRSWTNGSTVIYADSEKFPDDRRLTLGVNSAQEFSVQLKKVTVYDEGKYTCTLYSQPVIRMSVYLKVNVPARFTSKISSDTTLNEGQKSVLTCAATGKPEPQVTWRHLVPSADGVRGTGFHLPLSRITREGAGIYECTADNKIAVPVTHRIRVTVRYPPEMNRRRMKSKVYQALGEEVVIDCSASAVPVPEFTWKHYDTVYRRSPAQSRVRVLNVRKGNTVTSKLIIKPVTLRDLGEYVCIAKNQMGSANTTVTLIELIPEPTRPPPSVIFEEMQNQRQNGDDGNSVTSQHTQTLTRIFNILTPLIGLKVAGLFHN